MSRPPNLNEGDHISFPRVSGDEPSASDPFVLRTRFSPRERG